MSNTRKQHLTAQYISFWGVPKNLHVRPSINSSELAIFEFKFGELTVLTTNGMSEVLQPTDNSGTRTELYLKCEEPTPWMLSLLDALVNYPSQRSTYLAEFDTIPVGQPLDGAKSPYTAILIAPPMPGDPEGVGVIPDLFPEFVLLHCVIGIYDKELSFAIEYGGKALWNKLVAQNSYFAIDRVRTEATGYDA